MPQPSTTAELLLREVADLLTEIRDLLRGPAADPMPSGRISEPAAPATQQAPRRARKTTTAK